MLQLALSSPLPSCPVVRRLFLDELKVLEHLEALRRWERMAGVVPRPLLCCIHADVVFAWQMVRSARRCAGALSYQLGSDLQAGPCSSLPHPPTPLGRFFFQGAGDWADALVGTLGAHADSLLPLAAHQADAMLADAARVRLPLVWGTH